MISEKEVKKLSNLANLPIDHGKVTKYVDSISKILDAMKKLKLIDTSRVNLSSNSLHTILRSDKVDRSRMFSQEEALKCAKKIKEGYFVTDSYFD